MKSIIIKEKGRPDTFSAHARISTTQSSKHSNIVEGGVIFLNSLIFPDKRPRVIFAPAHFIRIPRATP
jgi:hypothetical protein